ncbi:MAG: hypothetical protein PVJ40_03295 [Gammaproteobacteria bacterium]
MSQSPENPGTGSAADGEEVRKAHIERVARLIFQFGADSAHFTGQDMLNQPEVNTYFLLYLYGAADGLGEVLDDEIKLDAEGKALALGEALRMHGGAEETHIRGTVKMLASAHDDPALAMKAEGHDTAVRWFETKSTEGADHFNAIIGDGERFPRQVEQVRGPLPGEPTN